MKNYGRTSVYEFLGDNVVYRNLDPVDSRLPALAHIRQHVDLPAGVTPRKSEPAYARAMIYLLKQARTLDLPDTKLERLVYVGDTRLNDGTAFRNMCKESGWPGIAFIGSENDSPEEINIVEHDEGTLYLSNRWAALDTFNQYCLDREFPIDERTAVIVDLDKTAVGARGRNDRVINEARVAAVRLTVEDLLGDDFNPTRFQAAYDTLNETEFHPFTTDNQDYLAYICLVLGTDLYDLEPLVTRIRNEQLTSFEQFISEVDRRANDLPANLRGIHDDVYSYVQANDPTPFKAFRYNEYHTTTDRMGQLVGEVSAEELLRSEIVITQEVRESALRWRNKGALLFGLSDKPDEASIPTKELAQEGRQPIHRTETHAVGE